MNSNRLLHPLLRYSQHDIVRGHCSSILWDLRESPEAALYVENLEKTLSFYDLSHLATTPASTILHLTCGIFPEAWPIEVRRLEGVTVGDVLHAIHSVVNRRIKQEEWDRICEKQQKRIAEVFDNRCKLSPEREECRKNGVLRVDCLLSHILFAGLSPLPEEDGSFILTLRRPQPLRPNADG